MATIANLVAELSLADKGFSSGIQKAGGSLKKLLAVGAIVGAGAAVGKVLYDIGSAADDMNDTIAVATGKTGKAFDDVQSAAMHAFKTLPTDMHTAAVAASDLSNKT